MRLHILFGHRKEHYEGEHAPEPLLCWSEYEVDENPEGFDEEIDAILKDRGSDFAAIKLFVIHVDGDEVVRRLHEVPELKGKIELPQ